MSASSSKLSEDGPPASSMQMTMGFMDMLGGAGSSGGSGGGDGSPATEGKATEATRRSRPERRVAGEEKEIAHEYKAPIGLMSKFVHCVSVTKNFDEALALAAEILEHEPENAMVLEYVPVLKAMKEKVSREAAGGGSSGDDNDDSSDGDDDGSEDDDTDSGDDSDAVAGAGGGEIEEGKGR